MSDSRKVVRESFAPVRLLRPPSALLLRSLALAGGLLACQPPSGDGARGAVTEHGVVDPSGMAAYLPAVQSGGLAGVVTAPLTSAEFEARRPSLTTVSMAEELYTELLARPSDPAGSSETASRILQRHAAARNVAMLLSPEYSEKNSRALCRFVTESVGGELERAHARSRATAGFRLVRVHAGSPDGSAQTIWSLMSARRQLAMSVAPDIDAGCSTVDPLGGAPVIRSDGRPAIG